jgi:hypothetical protein
VSLAIDYSGIETTVLALLQSEPGLAGVKKFETGIREGILSGELHSRGFADGDLPAVQVTVELDAVQEHEATSGEVQAFVPLAVLVLAKHQKKSMARSQALTLSAAVQKALRGLRKSAGNPLGMNAWVAGEMKSDVSVVEQHPFHYALGTVGVTIMKVVDL